MAVGQHRIHDAFPLFITEGWALAVGARDEHGICTVPAQVVQVLWYPIQVYLLTPSGKWGNGCNNHAADLLHGNSSSP